jgi:hypothetical protein
VHSPSLPPVSLSGTLQLHTTNIFFFYSPGNPYTQGEKYLKMMKESKYSILLGKYKDSKLEPELEFPDRFVADECQALMTC